MVPSNSHNHNHNHSNTHGNNALGWRSVVPFNPHNFPLWEPERPIDDDSSSSSLAKKKEASRAKRTTPKPLVVEVSEESEIGHLRREEEEEEEEEMMEEEEGGTPGGGRGEEGRRPFVARRVGRPSGRMNSTSSASSRGNSNGEEEDYRRFSERSKKKTEFFGVNGHRHEDSGKGRGRKALPAGGRGQPQRSGRSGGPVKRPLERRPGLDFGRNLHLLDDKLAGVSSSASSEGMTGKEVLQTAVSHCGRCVF